MSWLTDLLKEYPALSVARERLALLEARLDALEAENKKLSAANQEMEQRLSEQHAAAQFSECGGVFWKRGADGGYQEFPFCPSCQQVLSPFPPGSDETLICSKCDFIAPFLPSEVSSMRGK